MYFECDCGAEVINVERDLELVAYGKQHYIHWVNFCIYHCGTENHKPTLKEKLRHCWVILKTGKNYADQIALTEDAARKLGKYLVELTNEDNVAEAIREIEVAEAIKGTV